MAGAGVEVMTRGDVLDCALKARDRVLAAGVPSPAPAVAGLGDARLPDLIEEIVVEARYGGLDHVVLIGMGAAGLAAAAIADEAGVPLTLVDDLAPHAMLTRLDRTLVVLADKRSGTLEVDCHRRIFEQAFADAGLSAREIARRFVVVTDAGSPWEQVANTAGYRLVRTDPKIPAFGGALGAYGFVAAALAGAEIEPVVDAAYGALSALTRTEENPGLLLGAILGGCLADPPDGVPLDKLVLESPPTATAFGGWLEQVLSGALGKMGQGVLMVDAARAGSDPLPDSHAIAASTPGAQGRGTGLPPADTMVWGPIGAQFVTWEHAAAVAAWLAGVDPYAASDTVAVAEANALSVLRSGNARGEPLFTAAEVEVFGRDVDRSAGLTGTLDRLLGAVPANGYLGVVTYVAENVSPLVSALGARLPRPVLPYPAPRYLYRSGPYHTGGPRTGAFLVLSGNGDDDVAVPGTAHTLGSIRLARARADAQTLWAHGLPVLHLHLRDVPAGLAALTEAAAS
jgi:glucose-6-phosphate isomerase